MPFRNSDVSWLLDAAPHVEWSVGLSNKSSLFCWFFVLFYSHTNKCLSFSFLSAALLCRLFCLSFLNTEGKKDNESLLNGCKWFPLAFSKSIALSTDLNPFSLLATVALNGNLSWVNSMAQLGPPARPHLVQSWSAAGPLVAKHKDSLFFKAHV